MPDRNFRTFGKVLLALALLLLGANSAMAYVGPGADLAFLSYALTLLAWILAAFSAVLMWPVYALLRKIRRNKNKSTTQVTQTVIVVGTQAKDSPQQKQVHDDFFAPDGSGENP
jgi:membrane protein implicated in regulation of membrane protease activity